MRSSRRAVNGHQYLETTAAHITPMMTLVDRWKAIDRAETSRSRELYLALVSIMPHEVL